MAGFPGLQPAFTLLVTIDAPLQVGSASKGTPLAVVPLKSFIIKSEPGFSPALDGEIVGVGNDYIHNDASGGHMRLDAHGVVKDKGTGGLVYVHYTGVVAITPALAKVLSGDPEAESTQFGDSFVEIRFETGEAALKDLETGVFVGAGRFLVGENQPTTVEYKISKLVKGSV